MWLLAVLEEGLFREGRSVTTLVNYAVALKRWAAFGVQRIMDVTAPAAQEYVEHRLATIAIQSVATEYAALLSVLTHLERTGRFPSEGLAEVRRLAPRAARRQQFSAPYLSAEQLATYCVAAPAAASWLARLACYTGLRASELSRLRWEDVDLAARVLSVGSGKTGARRVPLCAPAIDLLAPQVGVGRVFGVGPRTLQERLREARVKDGPEVTLTLCRHTRASWWVQSGVPLAKVAKWLGHSVEVCARHYAGLADTYDPAAELGAAG